MRIRSSGSRVPRQFMLEEAMTPTTKSVGAGCARAFFVLDWLHGCTQARVLQQFPVCIISVFLVAGGSVSSARPGCVGSSLLKFPVDSSPRPALG